MDTKSITIDYYFLDNESCTRCMETEKTLESSLDAVQELLIKSGLSFKSKQGKDGFARKSY
jgi:hypothetical protein